MFKRSLLAALLLATPALADITPEANACIDELRARHGNVGGEVLGQEGSEAGTLVHLRDGKGVEYECVVWSGPEVADLRAVGGEQPAVVSGTQRVHFATGATGTTLSGTLNANDSVRYVLGASKGQDLQVHLSSHGGALDYRIENPDTSALLDLISSDRPYQGQLWQSGDHVVQVLNAGAQPVGFDLRIDIK